MKRIFFSVFAAVALAACGESQTDSTTSADTMTTTEAYAGNTAGTRTPGDGDVTWQDNRVRVYRNNTWEDANDDVRFDNGVVVRRDGRVVRDGREYEYEDGYIVDRDGNVWDRTGNAMADAWDATKHGVKEAGKAIGDAGEAVGEKAKDAVD